MKEKWHLFVVNKMFLRCLIFITILILTTDTASVSRGGGGGARVSSGSRGATVRSSTGGPGFRPARTTSGSIASHNAGAPKYTVHNYYNHDGLLMGIILLSMMDDHNQPIVPHVGYELRDPNVNYMCDKGCIDICVYTYRNTSVYNNFTVTLTANDKLIFSDQGSYFCGTKCNSGLQKLSIQSVWDISIYVETYECYDNDDSIWFWIILGIIVILIGAVACICWGCCQYIQYRRRSDYETV